MVCNSEMKIGASNRQSGTVLGDNCLEPDHWISSHWNPSNLVCEYSPRGICRNSDTLDGIIAAFGDFNSYK